MVPLRASLALGLLLAACPAAPDPALLAPPVPVPPGPSGAEHEPSPPAPPRTDTTYAPPPPVTPALSYADPLPVLRDVCSLAEESGEVGCSCCPPFHDCMPAAGTGPVAAPPAYAPRVVLFGSFSAPQQEEVVMGTSFACEDNLSAYGHVVMASKVGGRWKLNASFVASLQYASAYPLSNGRALPVVVTVTGKTPSYSLATWDFSRPANGMPFTSAELIGWTTTAYAGCTGVEPGTTVNDTRILSLALEDRGGDGQLDLVAELLVREGSPNPAYEAACQAYLESETGLPDAAAALRAKRLEHVFHFDGRSLRP